MEAPDEITPEQIRERAYDLWERNHRPEGFEMQFWLVAERELKAERDRKQAQMRADEAKSPPTAPADHGREQDQRSQSGVSDAARPQGLLPSPSSRNKSQNLGLTPLGPSEDACTPTAPPSRRRTPTAGSG